MTDYKIIQTINGPEDVKKLSMEQLEELASEIREALFNRLTKIGGHFGPNFGMVEAEIAMHYVFSSPKDKFVFDVSHQSYPHKILTGRKNGYISDEHFSEDSGYTNPEESEHDFFNVGHTSTSVSLATGLAKARDIKGDKENIIAIIGDGSLSGGEALEGLNVAGSEINSNLIIIVNDNEQSIAEVHGGMYKNLAELRETGGTASNNLFKAFGLDYIYEENGNDIASLISLFHKVKDTDHPIVVHIHTQKGKGYEIAEKDKEGWHWCMPFDRETGKPTISFGDGEDYTSITAEYIMRKAKSDSEFLVITPAMPGSAGLNQEQRKELGLQYVDVGIAEEQAVAMASGAAKNGAKPLVVTNTTFIQRAYDQISHPQTRIIDMMYYDEEGVYFLTATGKTFYDQLMEQQYVAISATKDKIAVSLRGKIKNIGKKNLDIMFEKNPYMKKIYPGDTKDAIEVFRLYEAQGEYFDISNPSNIVRDTITIGKTEAVQTGYFIGKECIGCKLCYSVCPQKCIDISSVPVTINQNHCLHCGRCAEICPKQCIEKRGSL
jgi:uncharacterized pyridoxamine 5'-phosphate oxidase family protein/transketolase N-terminal domain/subunit/NAD-dependent dihydropyrimidine dehydrogenase PreA subunit